MASILRKWSWGQRGSPPLLAAKTSISEPITGFWNEKSPVSELDVWQRAFPNNVSQAVRPHYFDLGIRPPCPILYTDPFIPLSISMATTATRCPDSRLDGFRRRRDFLNSRHQLVLQLSLPTGYPARVYTASSSSGAAVGSTRDFDLDVLLVMVPIRKLPMLGCYCCWWINGDWGLRTRGRIVTDFAISPCLLASLSVQESGSVSLQVSRLVCLLHRVRDYSDFQVARAYSCLPGKRCCLNPHHSQLSVIREGFFFAFHILPRGHDITLGNTIKRTRRFDDDFVFDGLLYKGQPVRVPKGPGSIDHSHREGGREDLLPKRIGITGDFYSLEEFPIIDRGKRRTSPRDRTLYQGLNPKARTRLTSWVKVQLHKYWPAGRQSDPGELGPYNLYNLFRAAAPPKQANDSLDSTSRSSPVPANGNESPSSSLCLPSAAKRIRTSR
uniref:Uncharacterized protein n=1 Tax=Fagus sylvatica TaxID=28930 RepID=A0A2N9GHW0_FAGSY